MTGIIDFYSNLSWIDVIYAAITAFVLTNLINSLRKLSSSSSQENENKKVIIKTLELEEMKKKCESIFPIETVYFNGKVFSRGMNVKIITLHKRIIEGILVGRNSNNVVCIITPTRIVAHDIEKIESLTEITKEIENQ